MYHVIVYGISGTLELNEDYIEKRFKVVGYSDSNPEKKATLKQPEMYIWPADIVKADFDYILITSIFDEEIKESLVSKYSVPQNKILLFDEWQGLRFQMQLGERHPDKTFYVLSRFTRYRDGLFSHIYSYLEQLLWIDKHDVIPVVDMMNYRNQYLEDDKFGLENSWEYYFEPLSDIPLEEVYDSRNVILGYDKRSDFSNLSNELESYSMVWKKYIHMKPDIEKKINAKIKTLFDGKERILGVLYRGTDYKQLKLKKVPVQPDLPELFELIDAEFARGSYDGIFVSSESEYALEEFKNRYGHNVIYTDQKRFSDTKGKWLSEIEFNRKDDRYLRGYEYLETIMILSECTSLIAGICHGSICAKIINGGKYENELLIEKGVY